MRKLRKSKVNTTGHKGNTSHPLYNTWKSMITRCYYESCEWYYLYGGRGIKVADEWLDFNAFVGDMYNKPHPEYQLDRIDNNLGYSRENCRWVSPSTNSMNVRARGKSGHKGVYKNPNADSWFVSLRVNRKNTYVGSYKTKEEAILAYEKAAIVRLTLQQEE